MRSLVAVGSLVVLGGCCIQTKGWEEYCEAPRAEDPPASAESTPTIANVPLALAFYTSGDAASVYVGFDEATLLEIEGPCPKVQGDLHLLIAGERHELEAQEVLGAGTECGVLGTDLSSIPADLQGRELLDVVVTDGTTRFTMTVANAFAERSARLANGNVLARGASDVLLWSPITDEVHVSDAGVPVARNGAPVDQNEDGEPDEALLLSIDDDGDLLLSVPDDIALGDATIHFEERAVSLAKDCDVVCIAEYSGVMPAINVTFIE